jgi:sRNA-binding carbon storage regulator CsrA
MTDRIKRLGEQVRIPGSLTVTVPELSNDRVKLGIRSLRASPDAMPRISSKSPGRGLAHYHSHCGVTTLVVSSTVGKRMRINDTIHLMIERSDSDGFQLLACDGLVESQRTRIRTSPAMWREKERPQLA